MSGDRLRGFEEMKKKIGIHVELISYDNLKQWEVPSDPLHPGFYHLSAIHQSDHLAAYLMHHHGGGYSDVKPPSGSWAPYFARMDADNGTWAVGPREGGRGGVACLEDSAYKSNPTCSVIRKRIGETETRFANLRPEVDLVYRPNGTDGSRFFPPFFDFKFGVCCEAVRDEFACMLTVQAFIMRPRTPLTAEWLSMNNARLQAKLEALKQYPSPWPRCCGAYDGGYPMKWAELKGDTLHPLYNKYWARLQHGMAMRNGGRYKDLSSEGPTAAQKLAQKRAGGLMGR